jgi:hypothetical protein
MGMKRYSLSKIGLFFVHLRNTNRQRGAAAEGGRAPSGEEGNAQPRKRQGQARRKARQGEANASAEGKGRATSRRAQQAPTHRLTASYAVRKDSGLLWSTRRKPPTALCSRL